MIEMIKVEDCGENIGDYDIPIYNAIIVPKGATNGDVLKALFGENALRVLDAHNHKSWWNSPYRGGRNESSN